MEKAEWRCHALASQTQGGLDIPADLTCRGFSVYMQQNHLPSKNHHPCRSPTCNFQIGATRKLH